MKKQLLLLVLLITTGVHQQALAQDDRPWWKKLFRKETVDEMDQPTKQQEEADTVLKVDDVPAGVDSVTESSTDFRPLVERPGKIELNLPDGFGRLDSTFREDPPKLEGYRVQVYFGDLNSAREQRSTYISESYPYPAYLVQNPPNFAVQIGDFRDQLEAYRVLTFLKETYPAAIVVPAEIEWPSVEPVVFEKEDEE